MNTSSITTFKSSLSQILKGYGFRSYMNNIGQIIRILPIVDNILSQYLKPHSNPTNPSPLPTSKPVSYRRPTLGLILIIRPPLYTTNHVEVNLFDMLSIFVTLNTGIKFTHLCTLMCCDTVRCNEAKQWFAQ